MTRNEKIRETIELIGIVAVVLSLLLVAYEVRQSNRIAQATTTYEIARDINQFNELGYSDPEFALLLDNLRDESFEPTPVEYLQIRLLANRFVNVWVTQEFAYENGLLSEDQIALTKLDVVTVTNAFPGLIEPLRDVIDARPGSSDSDVLEPLIERLESQ